MAEERDPGGAGEPEPQIDIEHYRLIERRERLDTSVAGHRLAREAVDNSLAQQRPLLEAVMETAETAKAGDLTTRRNANTAAELAELVFALARRTREELTTPPPPPRPGALEVIMGGVVDLGKTIFGGKGDEILELAGEKLLQLQQQLAPAAPPAAAQEPQRAAPAAPAEGPLPDLGVLFPELPPELQGLTLEEMRAGLMEAARRKARGG